MVWLLALTTALASAQDAPLREEAPEIKPIQVNWSPADQAALFPWIPWEASPGAELSLAPAFKPSDRLQPEGPSPKSKATSAPSAGNASDDPDAPVGDTPPPARFQWREAIRQAMLFNALQHALRFATEDGTRKEINGPFFRDWFQSVRNLRGWRDGDPFLVNYIGHPIMGAAAGYIQIHNDPKGQFLEFAPRKKAYWKSRMKAMAWSAAYSAQFEIGPLSEASLGNVGRAPRPDGKSPMSYVDLVITPSVGTLWLIGEDALDKHLIQRLERRVRNPFWRGMARSFLNPGRSVANAMRFRWPWHRDQRKLHD
ncbi:MAG: hypothetical protein CFK52_05590 [Chloracidobacterium sp. CP2_5A]|nr:MAG: hypothetical protein CFK52_05590 [Chloracidobacterium sp. CP2_5A]